MPPPFKNSGGALSVTPVRACVHASIRPLSKLDVRSITFERLHWFNSNLVCWYIISKHRWVQFGLQSTYFWQSYGPFIIHSTQVGVRSITFERLHRFHSYLACWYIISKHRSSSIWVTIHQFLTELWAFYKNIAHLAGASVSYGHISSY